MAVALRSTSNTGMVNISSGSPIKVTITKPTGLTVGDLMIAQCSSANGPYTFALAGWTQLYLDENVRHIQILYRIADAADAAASNFVFDTGATSSGNFSVFGGMFAISGQSTTLPIWASSITDVLSNTTTPSFSGITPAVANSILILYAQSNSSTQNVSGYAIATDNPTWTEQWDINATSMSVSCATSSVRSQTTSTGAATVTGTTSTNWTGILIAIAPDKSFTGSDTVSSTDNVTALRGLSFTGLDIVSTTDSIIADAKRIWTNVTKNINTWINKSKDI